MMFGPFAKGVGVGLIAGAAVGLMISPKTKKKVLKSRPVRALRSIGEAVEDMMP
jgi:gas vesicle protein